MPELARGLQRRGESDGVVEGEAEGLMSLITAFVVEEVVVQIIANSEQRTASCVRSRVDAVRTGNTPCKSS